MTWQAVQMGDYGAYVWSCYGLTLVALVWLVINARAGRARELLRARRRLAVAQSASPSVSQEETP